MILLESKEQDGYTILKFKRKLNTCDKDNDMVIKKETNYLIAAWNEIDPQSEDGWIKHASKNKRVKVDFLLGFRDVEEDLVAIESQNATAHEYKLSEVFYPKL